MKSKKHWRRLISTRWLAAALCSAALCGAQDSTVARVSIRQIDGTTAVQMAPQEIHGGALLPVPAAIFNPKQGAVAVRIRVAGFPSNGTVLDFGGGDTPHLLLSESYDSTLPGPANRGHFRLSLHNGSNYRATTEGSMLDAGASHLLIFTWSDRELHFWVDGKDAGATPIKRTFDEVPDRLALIEPIGIHYEQIEIWSRNLPYEVLSDITAKPSWAIGPESTYSAALAEGRFTAQWIGPGLMKASDVLAAINKPIISHEYFVSVFNGDDKNPGNPGAPFKTIQHSATVATAGDVITVLPGTYRESIDLRRSGTQGHPITFRASAEGPVILDGTDKIDGFSAAESNDHVSLWVKTDFQSRDVVFGDARTISILTSRGETGREQLERRGRVDTLWIDRNFVPKASSRASMQPYSFWVDKDKRELVLALPPRSSPKDFLIEVGARGSFFTGNVSFIRLQGFQASRADTPYFAGAIAPGLTSSNWSIENITASWNNWAGILLHGWGHALLHNVTDNNVDDGIEGTLCQYIVLDGNIVRSNNWQPSKDINPDWGSGGSKFTQSDHILIRNHYAAFNRGPGVWFDEHNSAIVVENSTFHHNSSGIMAEISTGPFLFRGNIAFGNDEAGILIAESAHVTAENNTLVANRYGVELRNIPGRTGAALAAGQKSFKLFDISLSRNLIANNRTAGIINTFVEIKPQDDRVSSGFNLFFDNASIYTWPTKKDAGSTATIGASNDWAVSVDNSGTKFFDLHGIQKLIGLEGQSVSAKPNFRMPELNDYHVDPQGPAATLKTGSEFAVRE